MHTKSTVSRRQQTVLKTIMVYCLASFGAVSSVRADLPQTIEKIRASVVGVGTYQKTRTPAMNMLGTGFVVGDGLHIITNVHVKPAFVDTERKEVLVVLTGRGKEVQVREMEPVSMDSDHDVALFRIKGAPLPALTLGDPTSVREGREYAFTGFPIGAILGLYHVTHRAMISSLTPVVIPSRGSRDRGHRRLRSARCVRRRS